MSKAMKTQEENYETRDEVEFAVQEWGIKNNLRLFGITLADYGEPGKNSELKPRAKAYFTDTDFKSLFIIFFDIKETKGKITVSMSGAIKGVKWPIEITRTRGFDTIHIDPISPLYWVLLDREIIYPFKSTMKRKEWGEIAYEDWEDWVGMEPMAITKRNIRQVIG
jgi:hypothetical protein